MLQCGTIEQLRQRPFSLESLTYLLLDLYGKSLLTPVLGQLEPLKNSKPGNDMIISVFWKDHSGSCMEEAFERMQWK